MLCDTDKGNSSELGFASAKSCITSGIRKVLTPRKFRPRENFPSNRSSELENPIELEKFTELKLNLGKFLQGIFR